MELTLNRTIKTEVSTIGELFVNGIKECFTLEDVERNGLKVYGKTAIPKGRYEVVVTFSNRFQKLLPLLLNVPNFEGIRIHPGNKAEDTEGCLLVGVLKDKNFIGQSKLAFNQLFKKLVNANKKEKIFINIQ